MTIDKNKIDQVASMAAEELGIPQGRVLDALRGEVFKWEIEAQIDEVVGGVPNLIDSGQAILIEGGMEQGKTYACEYLIRKLGRQSVWTIDPGRGLSFFPFDYDVVALTDEDPHDRFIRPTDRETVRLAIERVKSQEVVTAPSVGTLLVADNLDSLCYSVDGLREEIDSAVKSDQQNVLLVATIQSNDFEAPFSIKLVQPDDILQHSRVLPRQAMWSEDDGQFAAARPGSGQSFE